MIELTELITYNPYNCPISELTLNEIILRKYDKEDARFKKTRIQIPRIPTVLKTTGFLLESVEVYDMNLMLSEPELQRYATILGEAILRTNPKINQLFNIKKNIMSNSHDLNDQAKSIMKYGFSYECHFFPSRVWLSTVEYVSASISRTAQILNLSIPEVAIGIYAVGLSTAEGIPEFNIKLIKNIVAQFNNEIQKNFSYFSGELVNCS